MPKSTNSTPSGFNEVPIHLQALNFLQHIEKFTLSKRARNTHAASKSRYKFRKLCQNVNAWKANPDKHLKDMKTAWSEWNIAGIRELREKPGTFLFMRAILTLTDDEESESEASHKTEPPVTDITRIIPNTGPLYTSDAADDLTLLALVYLRDRTRQQLKTRTRQRSTRDKEEW